jgi:hypothetical protein
MERATQRKSGSLDTPDDGACTMRMSLRSREVRQTADYALLVGGEVAVADLRRTVSSGAARNAHLSAWGKRGVQLAVAGADRTLPARRG